MRSRGENNRLLPGTEPVRGILKHLNLREFLKPENFPRTSENQAGAPFVTNETTQWRKSILLSIECQIWTEGLFADGRYDQKGDEWMAYSIFISHYSKEYPIAKAVKDLIEEAFCGFPSVFLSIDISRGTDWFQVLRERLTASDQILTIFTYKSAERPWVNIETGYGIMAGKVVTPLLFGGYTKSDLPVIYQLRQGVDCRLEDDVLGLYNSILAGIRERFPNARPKWSSKEFWVKWQEEIAKAVALVPVCPPRGNDCPIVWLLGSHRHLKTEGLRKKALQVCRVLARAFLECQMQLVMGASRMLEYLADSYEEFIENPSRLAEAESEQFRSMIHTEHALCHKPAPNPVILMGNLRRPSIRETFADTIGRFPDIAILIGGRPDIESGRSAEEYQLAIRAEIPLLPIPFTGGAAEIAHCTVDQSLAMDVEKLKSLAGNMDALGPLVVKIVYEQANIQWKQYGSKKA